MRINEAWYLGVDPGSFKTGFACVGSNGEIIKMDILPTEALAELLPDILVDKPSAVILGNGTNSKKIQELFLAAVADLQIIVVEESYSTEEARKLYWQENPPQGWRKIVPLGLQVPPVNLDGYAAVVLVRRYLQKK